MRKLTSRPILLAVAIAIFARLSIGEEAPSKSSEATAKARTFLVNLLDADLGLLPEYRGAKVYWLFHDNYLAAKVLNTSHPKIAETIRASIKREGAEKSGKIEILFGEAEKPLPFRKYELTDVRRAGNKLIRTEIVTATESQGWTKYADLLMLASIAEPNRDTARQLWNDALKMWDGNGFLDAAAKHNNLYATYKLALALIAANRFSPPAFVPEGLLEKLFSMQNEAGGWITDYDAAGKKVGLANVESTCLSILGIEAAAAAGPAPAK